MRLLITKVKEIPTNVYKQYRCLLVPVCSFSLFYPTSRASTSGSTKKTSAEGHGTRDAEKAKKSASKDVIEINSSPMKSNTRHGKQFLTRQKSKSESEEGEEEDVEMFDPDDASDAESENSDESESDVVEMHGSEDSSDVEDNDKSEEDIAELSSDEEVSFRGTPSKSKSDKRPLPVAKALDELRETLVKLKEKYELKLQKKVRIITFKRIQGEESNFFQPSPFDLLAYFRLKPLAPFTYFWFRAPPHYVIAA